MTKIKPGDIFEISTSKGKAYLHYVYNDKSIGYLVRVLPGLFKETPINIAELAASKERYMIYFPLLAAYKQKIVKLVGNHSVDKYVKPKYMRSKHIVNGVIKGWHIIDTDTWQRELTINLLPTQKCLSPWGIWNDSMLIEKLMTDWKLEEWE